MSSEATRLGATVQMCYVVHEYRPHRTKKGHFIWLKDRDVSGALTKAEVKARFPKAKLHSLHNRKLTADECIRMLAEDVALAGASTVDECIRMLAEDVALAGASTDGEEVVDDRGLSEALHKVQQ